MGIIESIRRNRRLRQHTFYVAGPMTGYQSFNYPLFDAVSYLLTATGYRVVSPANWDFLDPTNLNRLAPGVTHQHCLEASLALLETCSAIILLPGYTGSAGALQELTAARERGLEVFELHELFSEMEMQVLPAMNRL